MAKKTIGIKLVIPKELPKSGDSRPMVKNGDDLEMVCLYHLFTSDYEQVEIITPAANVGDGLERLFLMFGTDFVSYLTRLISRNVIVIVDERTNKELNMADIDTEDAAQLRRDIATSNFFAAQKTFEKITNG